MRTGTPSHSCLRPGTTAGSWRAPLMVLGLSLAVLSSACESREEAQMAKYSYSARVETDPGSGQPVVVLERQGGKSLVARIAPHAGANLYSLVYDGTELLRVPPSLNELPGYRYGTPVLYPAPNRIAGGKFSYGGREFDFGINEKDRFLHALVHSVAWQFDQPTADSSGATLHTWIDFAPGTGLYRLFGFDHRFHLIFTVDAEGARFTYRVENRDQQTLPFGFALHPYFIYQGDPASAFLKVPAQAHMEAVDLMPTGQLEPLDGSQYDLREFSQVDKLVLDEVYYGMAPEQPAVIEYRQAKLRIELPATPEFTHMVVYAQPENPFFCVENQTCSTDAHNLHAQGMRDVAHLLEVGPGQSMEGWVLLRVTPLD